MKESVVERHLIRKVAAQGGQALKWVSPGNAGVPDRIVVLRGVHMVELKSPTGKLSKKQKLFKEKMAKQGITVHVLYTKEAVEEWVRAVCTARVPATGQEDYQPATIPRGVPRHGSRKDKLRSLSSTRSDRIGEQLRSLGRSAFKSCKDDLG